eukprot:9094211-Alexandrium_andersonii.AAC.1
MSASLVGSEMCIRDSKAACTTSPRFLSDTIAAHGHRVVVAAKWHAVRKAVSYTHLTLPTICSV